jgi:hypothetical protein
MANLYLAINGAGTTGAPGTAAAPASVTTGTAIKTLLQVAPSTTRPIKVVEWGISFDGSAAATPIKVELVETDVAATVTAHSTTTVKPYDDPNAPNTTVSMGTTATGYTASAEGTIGAYRYFDAQLVAPTNQYLKQFPLGREPQVAISKFLRVRVTAAAAVNAYCYVLWEE